MSQHRSVRWTVWSLGRFSFLLLWAHYGYSRVFLECAQKTCWPLPFSFVALLRCDHLFCIMLPIYVNSCAGFSVVSSTLISSSLVVVEFGWNITSVFFYVDLQAKLWWCRGKRINNPMDLLLRALLCAQSQGSYILYRRLWQSSSLTSIYFCLRFEVCDCKEVCILAWLDVDSIPHVS